MTLNGAENLTSDLRHALETACFRGEIDTDTALRAAMSTDNSIYQIMPDVVVAPRDANDLVVLLAVLAKPPFQRMPLTARGGGTGTNGQSLNRGIIVDFRRHMNRMLAVDTLAGWADVEPGLVLDDLNEQLRTTGWFFAPETSTSNRCTLGGMVSTDASGKGSRIYGKTSDNLLGVELAQPEGLLCSLAPTPDWAKPMLAAAEAQARSGRAAFIANTPRLNRRFTGYDLERACPETGPFEWWRLLPGSEGTLGLISRIRVKLRRIDAERRLMVIGFDSFHSALAAATPLLAAEPTAIEVMDERVQALAERAGILRRLPSSLRATPGQKMAYVFVEFNSGSVIDILERLKACDAIIQILPGVSSTYVAADLAEIRELWAIRSAGVGLLGKVDGLARPIAFVEDCVVPPEHLPAFVEEFLEVLSRYDLKFGIYGHVDVGCLHIRPALDIDSSVGRSTLVAVSDAVFALTRKYGGVFWGEHGKGVRGAYLRDWIGSEAYAAFQGVKAAFDPAGRFNAGKLVSTRDEIMGIASTPFRRFNAPEGDPLALAFRCNGNAQCLSYAATTPMCPSFKASADLRHSPKGRADALRNWHSARQQGALVPELESDLHHVLDTCLGCKACASTCPVQVDVPTLRSAFYADYYTRNHRNFADRMTLWAERASPRLLQLKPVLRPIWPAMARLGEWLTETEDLPRTLAAKNSSAPPLSQDELIAGALPRSTVILVQDWFTALFDGELLADVSAGLIALGFQPRVLPMKPAGKAAQSLGDTAGFQTMAHRLCAHLTKAAGTGLPLIGLDPAFVLHLRQDYAKAGFEVPQVLLPQEFLNDALDAGLLPSGCDAKSSLTLLLHCTESTAIAGAAELWARIGNHLGFKIDAPPVGCCGMAGLFGHQRRHQAVSRKLFDLSWRRHADSAARVGATGYSCRCQSKRLAGRRIRHPLGLIADALQHHS